MERDSVAVWQGTLDAVTGQFDWLCEPDSALRLGVSSGPEFSPPQQGFDFSFVLLAPLMTLCKNERCHAIMTPSHPRGNLWQL